MTTDAKSSLTFDELFGSSPRDPGTLIDQWLGGALDAASEEAVVVHLLGSSYSRDEAALAAVMWEGAARSAAVAKTVVGRARIAIRRIADLLEVLGDSLPALDLQPVAVRSGEPQSLRSCSFDVGEARRLHVSPAPGGRFALSLEGGDPHPDADWILQGDAGRLIKADAADRSVVFTSVGPGLWALERREADSTTGLVEVSLQVDDD